MTRLSGKTPNRTYLWGSFGLVVEWARPGPSKVQLGPHPTGILISPRVNLDVVLGPLLHVTMSGNWAYKWALPGLHLGLQTNHLYVTHTRNSWFLNFRTQKIKKIKRQKQRKQRNKNFGRHVHLSRTKPRSTSFN